MHTWLQLFTIVFSHLTTSVTEISVCLTRMGIKREGAPRNFAGFKRLYDKVEESMTSLGMKKAKSKGKGKKRVEAEADDEDETVYQNEMATYLTIEVSKDTEEPEAFVRSLNWNLVRFNFEWRNNMSQMVGLGRFTRDNRLSRRRGERLLVMSGLEWNMESRARGRDWGPTATAITLETAVVESYRETVLKSANGAYELRRDLREYMESIAATHHAWHPSRSGHYQSKNWEFPDGFEAPEVVEERGPFDPTRMRKNLDEALPSAGVKKRKKDSLRAQFENLLKNKFLWTSTEGASPGTMETVAYHCIEHLWKVSERGVWVCLVGAARAAGLTDVLGQVAYFNARRDAHEKKKKDDEAFNPESVKTPPLEKRMHMKTEAYEEFVSRVFVFVGIASFPRRISDAGTSADSWDTRSGRSTLRWSCRMGWRRLRCVVTLGSRGRGEALTEVELGGVGTGSNLW